jgi:ABC-type multidrug transport system fused ATPase/permease subunit
MRGATAGVVGVIVMSIIGGLAEAAILVLVVRSALVLAGQLKAIGSFPLFGSGLSVGGALWISATLALLNVGSHYYVASVNARLATDVAVRTKRQALDAFIDARWECQALEREGDLHLTVSSLSSESAQLASSILMGWTGAFNVIALLSVAVAVSPVATGIVLLSGIVIFAVLRPMNSLTQRRSQAYVNENQRLMADVGRLSSMAMELRLFGVSDRAAEELRVQNERAGHQMLAVRRTSRFGSTLYRDLAMLFLVGAVAVLNLIDTGHIAGIGSVVLLVVRAANAAQSIQSMRQDTSERVPSLDLLLSRLEHLRAEAEHHGDEVVDQLGAVVLDHVTYRYAGTGGIEDLSMRIEPGEALGVIGPSGGGKSTLAQVLLRLRPPQEGTVTVAGRPYGRISDASWSSLTALVPQEPQLMEATVADNIRFLRPGISDAEVEAAAQAAHVADEIAALPQGFATFLNARGTGLSGGQKQRVAIARALVGRPQLLVLDEPTSALDSASEERLRQTIEDLRGTVTMVIIAHRGTTLSACDRLVQISHGRLVTGD